MAGSKAMNGITSCQALRPTLEQFEGSAPGVLAQHETDNYQDQTRRRSS